MYYLLHDGSCPAWRCPELAPQPAPSPAQHPNRETPGPRRPPWAPPRKPRPQNKPRLPSASRAGSSGWPRPRGVRPRPRGVRLLPGWLPGGRLSAQLRGAPAASAPGAPPAPALRASSFPVSGRRGGPAGAPAPPYPLCHGGALPLLPAKPVMAAPRIAPSGPPSP